MPLIERTLASEAKDQRARISEEDALLHSVEMVRSWRPVSEAWSLRFGAILPAAASIVPVYMTTNKIRAAHRLVGHTTGLMYTRFVPVLASMSLSYTMSLYTTKSLVLNEFECPVCLETRAVSFQMLTGVALPTLLSVQTNYMCLERMNVHKVPKLRSEARSWSMRMLHLSRGILAGNMAGQAILVSALVYLQQRQWYNMNQELELRIQLDEAKQKGQEMPRPE